MLIAGPAEGLAGGDGGDRLRRPRELWTSAGLAGVAADVYARAGVGPADIDVAQLYENFTGQGLEMGTGTKLATLEAELDRFAI